MINFLIFCFPVPRKQFFQMCLLINTVLSGISIFFIFGNGLSIYYIMTGFIGLLNFSISLIVQIKQRYDTCLTSTHNKFFAVSQIPLNIGFFFCQTMQRIEEIKESDNNLKIPFWITFGILLLIIYCYYIYYIHKVVGVCCQFQDKERTYSEYLNEETSDENNQFFLNQYLLIMINFLICCLPVTKQKFFYILVVLCTILSAIGMFNIFQGSTGNVLYGLYEIAYFGCALNAWLKFNQSKDHTTIHQHIFAYIFTLGVIIDIVYVSLTLPEPDAEHPANRTVVVIITDILLLLLGGYYSYYLLLSVEALPEKYAQKIDDNSRTEEYLEEDLNN